MANGAMTRPMERRQPRAGEKMNALNYSCIILAIISLQTLHIASGTRAKQNGNRMAASLDNLVKEQVVGEVIDSKPNASIVVEYTSGVKVQQGNELKPTQVKDEPKFSLETLVLHKDKLYTLAMVDPDAPSRKEPKLREILHFLVTNIPGNGDNSIQRAKGTTNAEYIGSGPPQGTGLHRYIFLLFEQRARVESPLRVPKTSRNGRVNFSIRKFAKDNNLGEPIAANFYQAQYDDYVPTLHAQLSQG